MDEEKCNTEEFKRLKKKNLFEYNLMMLGFVVLMGFLVYVDQGALLTMVFLVVMWTILIVSFYTLKTQNPIGTKTNRTVQRCERRRVGEKKWYRKKLIVFVILLIVVVPITIMVFVRGIHTFNIDYTLGTFPFIGAWIGYNVGETTNIKSLT
ncbi:hypothetical protein SAMN05421734_105174 [Pelagirhabdus alkalitolerans]|uniref:Uncharacterized protein n=1 Tax=Pelagirhabdus alkalitolerans TaxID=1612202 RepID=A0A1G6JX26_9BACI|nr:hypothetical protein [Pelagirhabdus alkalitolerans]SDC23280.1 hypothetical protein SAMN05421734_105174 [Pelagirhabdus alkalitolerans]